ncbi:MAG TPA: helix-turn-helix domain-containing protein [Candidatus Dormibacteraeota bacterium]
MPGEARSGRESILATADELFYERGFHAVGVDLIVARAGVAKTTMYRHFPSKDALIVAYLGRADERFWAWFEASLDRRATPARRLAGLFDALARLIASTTCRGCAFQATAAEFPDASGAGHATALAHKQAVRGRLQQLAADAGAADPGALGDRLLVLMDGAFASARMYGPDNPAAGVGGAARSLIDASLVPASRQRQVERDRRLPGVTPTEIDASPAQVAQHIVREEHT